MQKLPLKLYDYSNLEFDEIIQYEQNNWRTRAAFLLEIIVPALLEMKDKQEIIIDYLIIEHGLIICEQLENWICQYSNASLITKEYVQKIVQIQKNKQKLEWQMPLKEENEHQLVKI